jgi:hypothetical protein
MKNKSHDGPVRGLDFNPVAKNLLASGATNGQVSVGLKGFLYIFQGTLRVPNDLYSCAHLSDLDLGLEGSLDPLQPRRPQHSFG